MAWTSRTVGAFALSAALAAGMTVALWPPRSTVSKQAVVEQVLAQTPARADVQHWTRAVDRAHTLASIHAEGPVLELGIDKHPTFEVVSNESGNRFTINLYDTIVTASQAIVVTDPDSLLRHARPSLHAVTPQFVSRIECELASPAECAVRETDSGMEIRFVAVGDGDPSPTLAEHTVATYRTSVNRLALVTARYDEAVQRMRDRLDAEREAVASAVGDHEGPVVMAAFNSVERQILDEWAPIHASLNTAIDSHRSRLRAIDGETDLTAIRAGLRDAGMQVRQAHRQWSLYSESASAAIQIALNDLHNPSSSADDSMVLAALDSQISKIRQDTGLASRTPVASLAEATDHTIDEAVLRTAEASKGVAAEIAGAVTMAFARAQSNLYEASEVYLAQVAEDSNTIRLTNADVLAFASRHGADSVISSSRRDIQALPDADFTLPASRPVFAAQAEGEAAAGQGGAAQPAAGAAQPAEAAPPARPLTDAQERGIAMGAVTGWNDPELQARLEQLVDLEFQGMELTNAVAILAKKAGVNVVAGTAVTGTVTANLENVPLRRALEILLQLNGYGMVMEGNILRIVPLEEAIATTRVTEIVYLDKANAADVARTLEQTLAGGISNELISVSPNENTNLVLIAGPPKRVEELVALAEQLDIAEPVLPTFTEAIPLNYSEPGEVLPVIQSLLTPDIGQAEGDERSRHIIVSDVPAVIEKVREVVKSIDTKVKQVAIHAMLVDVVLRDSSQIGTNWLFEIFPDLNRRGQIIGDFTGATAAGTLGNVGSGDLDAGVFSFGLLNEDYSLSATIAAEAAASNAEILANPFIIATENKPAEINIVQEFPFQEFTQGLEGPPVATTEFKEIGIQLQVTPRVTHEDDVIVDLFAKQSSVSGITDTGVPIEDSREARTTLTAADGQSIFIGGLRRVDDQINTTKIPVLGDIPVLNFMFKNTDAQRVNTELMIFLTVHVVRDNLPDLTPAEQAAYDELGQQPYKPNAQKMMFDEIVNPGDLRDPIWKWRRTK